MNIIIMSTSRINCHFAYIKNLSMLVNNQAGNIKNKKWFCDGCFNHFSTEEILKRLSVDCKNLNKCKVILLQEHEKIVSFKNFSHKIIVPFVIYAVLESILVNCEG